MRSGSVASVLWVSEGKYSSKGRLLIVMAPSPVRSRTRATARLRRPVDWTSGFAIDSGPLGSGSSPGGGQIERDGHLGGVRVLGTGVDLQLPEHLVTERTFGKHALDRAPDDLFRLVLKLLGVADRPQSAWVAAVAVGERPASLAGCHDDLGGVDDDHVVTGVDMGGEDGTVLAAKHAGDLAREPPEDEAVGVDDAPNALQLARLGGIRAHDRPL